MHLGIDDKPLPPILRGCVCNLALGLLMAYWGSRNRPEMYIEKYQSVRV
jgi:hypothetical protein